MKKKILSVLCAATMTALLLAGCGNSKEAAGTTAAAETISETTAAETTAEEENETETTVSETTAEASEVETTAEGAASGADSADSATAECELADGIYTAEFITDSSMFRVNDAMEGKGTLTVENGMMTIHISLVSENIVNLFYGTAEDAQKEGAELLEPTIDTVTYSDGDSEEVYGFDVPVPALDTDFSLAILGTKGKWYDHTVSVTNAVAEN